MCCTLRRDPWDGYVCYLNQCCVTGGVPLGPQCEGDFRDHWDNETTVFYMNQLHPRPKRALAARGAQAAASAVYGLGGPFVGPVLAGCRLGAANLTLIFDTLLLAGETVVVSKPPLAQPLSLELDNTALWVLVNNSLPTDAGANHRKQEHSYLGPFSTGNELGVTGWVAVMPVAVGDNTVTIDLAHLGGLEPTAVRYAFGEGGTNGPGAASNFPSRICCGPQLNIERAPCPMESCPLHASGPSHLPAQPFVAAIVGGRCSCLAPQVCDA